MGGCVAVGVGLDVGDDVGDEMSVVVVAVAPGVLATLEAGVCDGLMPGVPSCCGVEVRDAPSDPYCIVWAHPAPLPRHVPGKATKRRPVMMPAMMRILAMLRMNTLRLAGRFLPAWLSAGKFMAIPY